MSSAGEPMIGDFGLSHMMSATQTLVAATNHEGGVKGTVRWMAAELFDVEEGEAGHTKASDMWAYGMTVYVSLLRLLCLSADFRLAELCVGANYEAAPIRAVQE